MRLARAAVNSPWLGDSRLNTINAVKKMRPMPLINAFWGKFSWMRGFFARLVVRRVVVDLRLALVPPRVALLLELARRLVVFFWAISQGFIIKVVNTDRSERGLYDKNEPQISQIDADFFALICEICVNLRLHTIAQMFL
jgi:hypothetical protein